MSNNIFSKKHLDLLLKTHENMHKVFGNLNEKIYKELLQLQKQNKLIGNLIDIKEGNLNLSITLDRLRRNNFLYQIKNISLKEEEKQFEVGFSYLRDQVIKEEIYKDKQKYVTVKTEFDDKNKIQNTIATTNIENKRVIEEEKRQTNKKTNQMQIIKKHIEQEKIDDEWKDICSTEQRESIKRGMLRIVNTQEDAEQIIQKINFLPVLERDQNAQCRHTDKECIRVYKKVSPDAKQLIEHRYRVKENQESSRNFFIIKNYDRIKKFELSENNSKSILVYNCLNNLEQYYPPNIDSNILSEITIKNTSVTKRNLKKNIETKKVTYSEEHKKDVLGEFEYYGQVIDETKAKGEIKSDGYSQKEVRDLSSRNLKRSLKVNKDCATYYTFDKNGKLQSSMIKDKKSNETNYQIHKKDGKQQEFTRKYFAPQNNDMVFVEKEKYENDKLICKILKNKHIPTGNWFKEIVDANGEIIQGGCNKNILYVKEINNKNKELE